MRSLIRHSSTVGCLLTVTAIASLAERGLANSVAFDLIAESNGWRKAGNASSTEKLELTFWLKLTNLQFLKERLVAASNPRSEDYGHYLSKDQESALTAPKKQNVELVKKALKGCHCRIGSQNDFAVMRANVSVHFAEKLFGGKYERFCRVDDKDECALRNPEATVPFDLENACDVITPLDDTLPPRMHPMPHVSPNMTSASKHRLRGNNTSALTHRSAANGTNASRSRLAANRTLRLVASSPKATSSQAKQQPWIRGNLTMIAAIALGVAGFCTALCVVVRSRQKQAPPQRALLAAAE